MKKIFVFTFALLLLSCAFANVRMDSMLLQNGELKDMIGDYLYSPTLFPDKTMVLYIGNADNAYLNESNVFTETNNWINTDYAKTTEDNYLLNILLIATFKNFVFGLNYNPTFQNEKNNFDTGRCFEFQVFDFEFVSSFDSHISSLAILT